MKLIITEKPSAANDIANALVVTEKGNGYLKTKTHTITWAFGHLFKFDDKEFSGPWSIEQLPLLPVKFNLVPIPDKVNQIKTIHSLIKDASEIIIATDAGREGELIGREILLTYKGKLPKCYRLWTSEALTPIVVARQLENLKPLENFDSLYYSAISRQESDWIVGINLTRLFSVKGNSVWSVGRVQTPVLSLIVNRDKDIANFKPIPFFTIPIHLLKDKINFKGFVFDPSVKEHSDRFDEQKAQEVYKSFENLIQAEVISNTTEKKKVNPPPLYSLTQLQRAVNRKFGLSAQETLDIAQSLYETHKCLSYPRTESSYLAEANRDMVISLLSSFAPNLIPPAKVIGKSVFDDSKLTDHHALLPLKEYPGSNANERNVFNLVKLSFIAAFMPPHIFESSIVTLSASQNTLPILVKGRRTVELGWKSLYQDLQGEGNGETDQEDATQNTVLPALYKNDLATIVKIENVKSFTSPPSAFTEESLLGQMQKYNLGTSPTRAPIIEKLIKVNYIKREKKKLFATSKGIELIETLKDSDIANPENTGKWEEKLESINNNKKGENGYLEFLSEIKTYTCTELNRFMDASISNQQEATAKMINYAKKLAKENKTKDFDKQNVSSEYISTFINKEKEKSKETTPCPCGKGQISESPKAWSCSSCNRTIWKEVSGKKLTLKQAISLLEGKSIEVKNLKSKAGKPYDGKLRFEEGKVKVSY